MAKLVPLSKIPTTTARNAERDARKKHETRARALEAARYEIVDAEGCYSGAYPDSHGWCCSTAAAEAIAAHVVHMPGGTQHHDLAVRTR